MKEKKTIDKVATGLAIITIGLGIGYFLNKYYTKKKEEDKSESISSSNIEEEEGDSEVNYSKIIKLSIKKRKFLKALKLLQENINLPYKKIQLTQIIKCYESLPPKTNEESFYRDLYLSALNLYLESHCESKEEVKSIITKRYQLFQTLLNLPENSNFEKKHLLTRKCLKDGFIISIIDSDNREVKEEMKKQLNFISSYETSKITLKGNISKVNYEDFLCSFDILFRPNDSMSILPLSGEKDFITGNFDRLMKHLNNSSSDSLILLAILFYIKGNYKEAINKISGITTTSHHHHPLSEFIRMLIKEENPSKIQIDELLKNLIKTPYYITALIIISKVSEKFGKIKQSIQYLQLALNILSKESVNSAPHIKTVINNYLLVNSIRMKKSENLIVDEISERIKRWKNEESVNQLSWYEKTTQINFLCLSIEYSLAIKNYKLTEDLYLLLNKYEDTRRYLFEHIITAEIDNNGDISGVIDNYSTLSVIVNKFKTSCTEEKNVFLDKAIELDPKYFKNYFYYGNYFMGTPLSIKMYKNGLKYASSVSEVLLINNVLIATEVQLEVYQSNINDIICSEIE